VAPAPTFVNGFDLTRAALAYDAASKTLYLGYRVAGLIGDTDGNGNPNTAGGPNCSGANVGDASGIGLNESYVWYIDTNCDGNPDIQVSVVGALPNPTVRIVDAFGNPLPGATGTAIVSGSDIKIQITGISDPNTAQAGLPAGFTFGGFVGATNDGLSEDGFAPISCSPPSLGITIVKTVSVATLCPGATTVVTLTIHNTSTVPLTSVTATDDLPPGISYVVFSTGGTCGVGEPTIAGQKLTWNVGTLAADQTCTITFTAQRVGSTCFGTVTNHSTATGVFQAACVFGGAAIAVGPATSDANLTCVDAPRVTLGLVCNPARACPGGSVSLDWTAKNTSLSPETIVLNINGTPVSLGTVAAGDTRTGSVPATMPSTCPTSGSVPFNGTADATNSCTGGADSHATASCDVTCSLPPCTVTGPTGNAICSGATAHLCGPSGNFTYKWSPGGATGQCIDVSPTTTTTYTLEVTDAVAGCKSSCPYTLTVNPPPPCTVTGPTGNAICPWSHGASVRAGRQLGLPVEPGRRDDAVHRRVTRDDHDLHARHDGSVDAVQERRLPVHADGESAAAVRHHGADGEPDLPGPDRAPLRPGGQLRLPVEPGWPDDAVHRRVAGLDHDLHPRHDEPVDAVQERRLSVHADGESPAAVRHHGANSDLAR
jgi:uncharacterized repeat protein (TIGR01451 family)